MNASTLPRPIHYLNMFAGAVARRVDAWTERIDAEPVVLRHRMGEWEVNVSPAAQAALHVMREREQGGKAQSLLPHDE